MEYSVAIAQKNYLRGVDEGVNKGVSRGILQGIDEGQNKLVKAIELLRAGKTTEEIAKTGIDQKTIDLAVAIK